MIIYWISSAGAQRTGMCHMSVSDDATYFAIRKSRLRVWCKHSQVVSQFLSSEWTQGFLSSCSSLYCFGFQLVISDYIGTLVCGIKGFVFVIIKHLCVLKNAGNTSIAAAFPAGNRGEKSHSVSHLRTFSVKTPPASGCLILLWRSSRSQPPSPVLQRMMTAAARAWSGVKMAAWGAAAAMASRRARARTPALPWQRKTPAAPRPRQLTPHPGQTSRSKRAPQRGRRSLQPTHLRDPFHIRHRRPLRSWCRGQTL